MPGEEVLADIYGVESQISLGGDIVGHDLAGPSPVIDFLRSLKPGTFVDYGCGYGSLLKEAQKLGWQVLGIEFSDVMATFVESSIGVRVVVQSSDLLTSTRRAADVLHLGDVLEHLTNIDCQLPNILELIKPGGYLIATGPLENNFTLFNFALRMVRSVRRRWHRVEMPPRHVMLATAKGQRSLFQRFGLQEISFSISEVSWPAPSSLSLKDIKNPRKVGLFALSRFSRAISLINSKEWGNRYFYVGRLNWD
jgi:SAM-dependent methyltransferase